MLEENNRGTTDGEIETPDLLRNAYWMGYRDSEQGRIEDPRFGTTPIDRGLRIREVVQALRPTPRPSSTSSEPPSSTIAAPPPDGEGDGCRIYDLGDDRDGWISWAALRYIAMGGYSTREAEQRATEVWRMTHGDPK